jgi:hypothetical protein
MFTTMFSRPSGDSRRRERASRLSPGEQLEQRHALAAVLSMTGPTNPVAEGQQAAFTLRLSEPSRVPQRVTVSTTPGTATYGVDYFAPVKQTILFAPGQTSQTFSIATLRDAVSDRAEGRETFTVVAKPEDPKLFTRSQVVTIIDTAGPASQFQITFNYDSSVTEQAKGVFQWAGDRLSQIITGDLPNVTYNGKVIDDFQINVSLQDLGDGLNGYASTLQTRPGPRGLPFLGEAVINSTKIGNPGIKYTIVHEIIHALGFSQSFWSGAGFNLFGGTTADPRYTGSNALREYNSIFGTQATGVPLAETGGPGTYGSHWRTSTFGTEILSVGWDTTRTDVRPFSRVTVGVMQDLGYQVNYLAADKYTKPATPSPDRNAPQGAGSGTRLPDNRPASATNKTSAPSPRTPAARPPLDDRAPAPIARAQPVEQSPQTASQRSPLARRSSQTPLPTYQARAFVSLPSHTFARP